MFPTFFSPGPVRQNLKAAMLSIVVENIKLIEKNPVLENNAMSD